MAVNGVEIEGDEEETQREPERARGSIHRGPWPVSTDDGRAFTARAVMMPPMLWRLAQAVALVTERKGASSLVRESLRLHIVRIAQDDPRVARLIEEHAAAEMLGVETETE